MDPKQLQRLMQQASAMQSKMAEAQQTLSEATFEGTAGGGVVTAVVRGSGDLVSVTIDPSVLDPEDPEMVGDLVVAAVSQAQREARAAMDRLVEESTGDLDLGSLGLGDLLG